MAQVLDVSTAAPTREVAVKLAESAISAGLAAGGQVTGPVVSVFWHEGQFGQGEEWKVSFKTTAQRYSDLESHLIANHVWANPEVTAVTISHTSAAYAAWVERVTS
jgi:periplasmic divalent cation tolerance protein